MERLWSRAGATTRNQRLIDRAPKPQKEAKSVAVACHRLPRDGKEGVDGSSPSEGSAKNLPIGSFPFGLTCTIPNVRWVWSALWSFQIQKLLLIARQPELKAVLEREDRGKFGGVVGPGSWVTRGAGRSYPGTNGITAASARESSWRHRQSVRGSAGCISRASPNMPSNQ
jgi:hypothetical protein